MSKSYKESQKKPPKKTYAEVVKTKPISKISKDDEMYPEEQWKRVTRTMARKKIKNKRI